MKTAHIPHHGAAHHDVVEVANHKVGVMDVDVNSERSQKQARQTAHGEQANEAKGVKHGRLVGDGTLVERGRPVKNLDGGRDGHREAQGGEDDAGVNRLAADEHVVSPDDKGDHGDGHAGKRHKTVAENALLGEAGDQFADHAHGGQNHDVDGRMRIKPEQVLEQNRVATHSGIENADMEEPFQRHEYQGDGNDRRPQNWMRLVA